jgi:hypothetical protein
MRSLVVLLMLGVLMCAALVMGYPSWDDGADEDDSAIDIFNNLQRRGWCARWGDYCEPDAKVKFADCCKGLRCVCGKFWTQAKCQCKRQSAFGR